MDRVYFFSVLSVTTACLVFKTFSEETINDDDGVHRRRIFIAGISYKRFFFFFNKTHISLNH